MKYGKKSHKCSFPEFLSSPWAILYLFSSVLLQFFLCISLPVCLQIQDPPKYHCKTSTSCSSLKLSCTSTPEIFLLIFSHPTFSSISVVKTENASSMFTLSLALVSKKGIPCSQASWRKKKKKLAMGWTVFRKIERKIVNTNSNRCVGASDSS